MKDGRIDIDDWAGYILRDYEYTLGAESVVIDIGCGEGEQLAGFAEQGHRAFGIDLNPQIADSLAKLHVAIGRAEALPFPEACADAVLVKVVLPYTDDRKALAEISRVLKPGGRCFLIGHGPGYSLRYVLQLSDWRRAVYGIRTLLNSALFFLTGNRLPGFWGDTIMQTTTRLNQLYRRNGLALETETPSPRFLGCPVFIYHAVRKTAGSGAAFRSAGAPAGS